MKIRAAPWMCVLAGPPCVAAWLLMVALNSEMTVEGLDWLYGAAVAFAVGTVVGLIAVAIPTSKFVDDRIMIRSKHGWVTDLELQEGDRWVIANGRVFLQRPDGTLQKTVIAKWALAKRDRRRLETMIPTIDPP